MTALGLTFSTAIQLGLAFSDRRTVLLNYWIQAAGYSPEDDKLYGRTFWAKQMQTLNDAEVEIRLLEGV